MQVSQTPLQGRGTAASLVKPLLGTLARRDRCEATHCKLSCGDGAKGQAWHPIAIRRASAIILDTSRIDPTRYTLPHAGAQTIQQGSWPGSRRGTGVHWGLGPTLKPCCPGQPWP